MKIINKTVFTFCVLLQQITPPHPTQTRFTRTAAKRKRKHSTTSAAPSPTHKTTSAAPSENTKHKNNSNEKPVSNPNIKEEEKECKCHPKSCLATNDEKNFWVKFYFLVFVWF